MERNKVKVATAKKKTKQNRNGNDPASHSSGHQGAESSEITPAAPSLATHPRRPLSAHLSPLNTGASSTAPPSQRRHSYNLDNSRASSDTVFEPLPATVSAAHSGGTASDTVFEPLPAASSAAVNSQEMSMALEEVVEQPFPNLGIDQPIENALPSIPPRNPAAHTSNSSLPSSSPPSPTTDRPMDGAATKEDVKPAPKKSRGKGPAGFPSAEDLMHRLFLGISGVADQLQTNHAKDLRVILKNVFAVCQSESDGEEEEEDVTSCQRESSHTKYSEGVNDLAPCTPEPQSPLITASQSKLLKQYTCMKGLCSCAVSLQQEYANLSVY